MTKPINTNELNPFTGMFALRHDAKIAHCVTPEGDEVLLCDPGVAYPDDTLQPTNEFLLSRAKILDTERRNRYALRLPPNYLPLGVVVSEAIETSSNRSEVFVTGVFKQIGQQLRRLKESGNGIKSELSFRQFIVKKEVQGVNILPPLAVGPGETTPLINLGSRMLQEYQESTENPGRKDRIATVFGGFWDGIGEGPPGVK